jgi:hypothetical protein
MEVDSDVATARESSVCSATLVDLEKRKETPVTPLTVNGTLPGQELETGHTLKWCWHCAHPFEGLRCTLPIRSTESGYLCTGIFCSYGCAGGWAIERKLHCNSDVMMLLNIQAQKSGAKVPIAPAPPAEFLEVFGGSMSLEEFRSISATSRQVNVLTDNQISLPVMLEGWGQQPSTVNIKQQSKPASDFVDNAGAPNPDAPYSKFLESKKRAPSTMAKKKKASASGPLSSFIKAAPVADMEED